MSGSASFQRARKASEAVRALTRRFSVTKALARFQREVRFSEGGRPRPEALQIEGPT
jgi:hypothetical protein